MSRWCVYWIHIQPGDMFACCYPCATHVIKHGQQLEATVVATALRPVIARITEIDAGPFFCQR